MTSYSKPYQVDGDDWIIQELRNFTRSNRLVEGVDYIRTNDSAEGTILKQCWADPVWREQHTAKFNNPDSRARKIATMKLYVYTDAHRAALSAAGKARYARKREECL